MSKGKMMEFAESYPFYRTDALGRYTCFECQQEIRTKRGIYQHSRTNQYCKAAFHRKFQAWIDNNEIHIPDEAEQSGGDDNGLPMGDNSDASTGGNENQANLEPSTPNQNN